MPGAFGTADETTLKAAAVAEPGTDGVDLVAEVSTRRAVHVSATGACRVVAYDFGIKATMVRHLAQLATVEVVPAATSAADVLARRPDGVFLANGPGDPAMVPYATDAIAELLGSGVAGVRHLPRPPAAGSCPRGRDLKLPFGHHGGNHPVRRLATGQVEITSQNHNFAVAADTLAGRAEVTHVNLNDGVCEGLPRARTSPAFSVQYHPEAGPGPHDARYLFEEFRLLMERTR